MLLFAMSWPQIVTGIIGAVLGMEVPHTHIHLVPLQSEGDLDFRKERPQVSDSQKAAIAKAILEEYEKL